MQALKASEVIDNGIHEEKTVPGHLSTPTENSERNKFILTVEDTMKSGSSESATLVSCSEENNIDSDSSTVVGDFANSESDSVTAQDESARSESDCSTVLGEFSSSKSDSSTISGEFLRSKQTERDKSCTKQAAKTRQYQFQYKCSVKLKRCEDDPEVKAFLDDLKAKLRSRDKQDKVVTTSCWSRSRPTAGQPMTDVLTSISGSSKVSPVVNHSSNHSSLLQVMSDPSALVQMTPMGTFELKCTLCSETHFLAEDLIHHKLNVHGCSWPMCLACAEELPSHQALMNHSCRAKFRCEACGILCKQPYHLNQHRRIAYTCSQITRYRCHMCGYTAECPEEMDHHKCAQRLDSSDVPNKRKRTVCVSQFPGQSSTYMKAHLASEVNSPWKTNASNLTQSVYGSNDRGNKAKRIGSDGSSMPGIFASFRRTGRGSWSVTSAVEKKQSHPQYDCFVKLIRCEDDPDLQSFLGYLKLRSLHRRSKVVSTSRSRTQRSRTKPANGRHVADAMGITQNLRSSKANQGVRNHDTQSALLRVMSDPNALVHMTPMGTFELKCTLCPETHFLAADLIDHKLSVHGCSWPMCLACTEEFSSQQALVSHSCRARFRCEACGILCKQRHHLTQHKRTCTSRQIVGYTCAVCGFSTGCQEELNDHICDEKPDMTAVPLEDASAMYVTPSVLPEHSTLYMNVSSEEPEFGINECSSTVSDNSDSSVLNYLCEECLNLFPSEEALQWHNCGWMPETEDDQSPTPSIGPASSPAAVDALSEVEQLAKFCTDVVFKD